MRRRLFFGILVCSTLTAVPVHACLNDIDSDSLAQEGRGLPDVVRVITGRFERNPPLFYQMRLRRVAREAAAHPTRLNLYDDAGVACDRLGRDGEAIAWMNKKQAHLAGTDWHAAPTEIREAWYRYYANVGTFRVHRWIRAGANRKNLTEVTQARDEIARAIEIKPNAHFNRERYQLAAMNWILNPTIKEDDGSRSTVSFADYLHRSSGKTLPDAQESAGVSGLIVLGGAWESVDVTNALANSLSEDKRFNMAYMAYLRGDELRAKGRTSLVTDVVSYGMDEEIIDNALRQSSEVKEKFHALRKEAEAWQKERTAFMLARLKQGRHPDTDPHFWDGYHASTSPPSLDNPSDTVYTARKTTARNFMRFSTVGAWTAMMLFPALLMLGALTLSKKMQAFYIRKRIAQSQRRTSRPE